MPVDVVVGLVASIYSILQMCSAIVEAIERLRSSYTNEKLRVEAIIFLSKSLTERVGNLSETDRNLFNCCLSEVKILLGKVMKDIKRNDFVRRSVFKPLVDERLDKVEKLLDPWAKGVSVRSNLWKDVGEKDKVPTESICADAPTIEEMEREGLYEEGDLDDGRFVAFNKEQCVVERMESNLDGRVDDRRERLFIVLKRLRAIRSEYVSKPIKLLEGEGYFYMVSKALSTRTLEDSLGVPGFDYVKVALCLCGAVKAIHRAMIVHESINSNNILVAEGGNSAALTSFLLSRGAKDARMSDGYESQDPLQMRRFNLFQAPERVVTKASYTFECDVYSVGVVMAEMVLGSSMVKEIRGMRSRADIIGALAGGQQKQHALADIAKECMSLRARDRPDIAEVYSRVKRAYYPSYQQRDAVPTSPTPRQSNNQSSTTTWCDKCRII